MEKPAYALQRTKKPLGKSVEKEGFFIRFSMVTRTFCLFQQTSWIRFRFQRLAFLPKNGETFRHKWSMFRFLPPFSTFSTPCGKCGVEIQTIDKQGLDGCTHILPTGFSTVCRGLKDPGDGHDGLLLVLTAGDQINQAVPGNGLGQ